MALRPPSVWSSMASTEEGLSTILQLEYYDSVRIDTGSAHSNASQEDTPISRQSILTLAIVGAWSAQLFVMSDSEGRLLNAQCHRSNGHAHRVRSRRHY